MSDCVVFNVCAFGLCAHACCVHAHAPVCACVLCVPMVYVHMCVYSGMQRQEESFRYTLQPYFFEAGSLAKFGSHCFQLGLLSACSSNHMTLLQSHTPPGFYEDAGIKSESLYLHK